MGSLHCLPDPCPGPFRTFFRHVTILCTHTYTSSQIIGGRGLPGFGAPRFLAGEFMLASRRIFCSRPRARLVFQTPPSLSLSNPTGTLGLTQNSDLQRNDPCNGSQHKSGEPFSQQRAGHIWRAPVKAEPCLVMMAASGYFGDHDFFLLLEPWKFSRLLKSRVV